MDLELEGKTAIVTGGSRGIGKAIARELALSGCDVVIGARNAESLDLTAQELSEETGRKVVGIQVDTTNTTDVERMVDAAAQVLGRIDILVNNAAAPGGIARGPLATISDDDVLEDLNTKVVGYLRCARAVGPYMSNQGWGRIINIGGTSARNATGANVSAGIRNAGLVNLTKYLAQQLGPSGVTVNLVHPGTTRTERETLWLRCLRQSGKAFSDRGEMEILDRRRRPDCQAELSPQALRNAQQPGRQHLTGLWLSEQSRRVRSLGQRSLELRQGPRRVERRKDGQRKRIDRFIPSASGIRDRSAGQHCLGIRRPDPRQRQTSGQWKRADRGTQKGTSDRSFPR